MTAAAPVLLFDFGGTLDADGVPWKERFHRLTREEGLDVPKERFDPAFYAACDVLEGAIPASAGLSETVARVAEGLAEGLRPENGQEGLLRRVGERFAEDAFRQLAGSAALLQRLRARGHRIGIVSNFYGNLQAVCEETGLAPWIDVAVDSTLAGVKKPDPKIFRAALAPLGASPAQAVFIGDSPHRDMAGARGLGMRHVWLKGETASPGAVPCCAGDAVITRLSELEGTPL